MDALAIVRRANALMFRNLGADAWDRRGIANDTTTTVRGFCAFLVVLFGIYPAAKASKLDPIEALRYE